MCIETIVFSANWTRNKRNKWSMIEIRILTSFYVRKLNRMFFPFIAWCALVEKLIHVMMSQKWLGPRPIKRSIGKLYILLDIGSVGRWKLKPVHAESKSGFSGSDLGKISVDVKICMKSSDICSCNCIKTIY